MSGPTEFLLARIAEDEFAWGVVAKRDTTALLYGKPIAPRMLAQCAAHRRIIELHEVKVFREWENPMDGPARQVDDHHCMICGWVPNVCDTIKVLAAAYADHVDYREEWRP